jgi:HPt (histidine-containing phosphotransfer) domain-containing protein
MLDQMRRQTEDIVRYYGELSRRISGTGIEGIPQLLELAKQLEGAIADVGTQELSWVGTEIKQLLDQLVHMDAQLQQLRELKMVLGQQPEADQARRRSSL